MAFRRSPSRAIGAALLLNGCGLFVPLDGYLGAPRADGDQSSDGATAKGDGAATSFDAAKLVTEASGVSAPGHTDASTAAVERAADAASNDALSSRDALSTTDALSSADALSSTDARVSSDARASLDAASDGRALSDAVPVQDANANDVASAVDAGNDASDATLRAGCSDGAREAFTDLALFPSIAGCNALWSAASLRAPATGAPCGNTVGKCAVPADACSKGWHVCATQPYGGADVSSKANVSQCATQRGAYVAAIGDQLCEPCTSEGSGAACCGDGCVQQNGSCIYAGQTAWFGVIAGHVNLCSDVISSGLNQGVLCCRDP